MNIFANVTGLLGEIQPEGVGRSLSDFFDVTTCIMERLGERRGLLVEYLKAALDAICETNIETSATCGFTRGGNELRNVCGGIIRGDNKNTEHPFYQTAKRYIDTHPFPYKDIQGQLEIYSVALLDEFYKYAVEKYYKEFSGKLETGGHITRITTLYNEICAVLGSDEPMEKLNEIIQKTFITVPVMASFTQGMTDSAILSLLYHEPETNKYVFEMLAGIKA